MELKKLREEIDKIDKEILRLLSERARLVLKIGEKKRREGLPIYSPAREREVMERWLKENPGPLTEKDLRSIYREISSVFLNLQKPLVIAYLGPEATFTHQAAALKFGHTPKYLPTKSIEEVFREVEKGKADFGVVPVENTTEGVETHTLDMFVESELLISDEILLKIVHNLLSYSPLEKIKKIYSHPQAIAQCRGWLEKNVPQAEMIEVYSTSRAVELAKKEKEAGAIASELASTVYNLPIQERGIEDRRINITRFLVIGKDRMERTGKDKTSIMFALKDEVGALFKSLEPFWRHGINLTKIESRPSKRRPWEYYFFVDMEGHREEERLRKALDELSHFAIYLKILGSYPQREVIE